MDTTFALKKLTNGQRAAVERKQVAGVFTMPALVDDVRALSGFDATNDRARRSALIWLIVTLVSFAATLWVGLAALSELIPFSVALLLAAVYFAATRYQLGRLDLSNNVREVALPFLVLLQQDIEPNQEVEIYLDLKPATDATKRVKESEPYARAGYYKVIDTTYRDPWFQGITRLADGSSVSWRILDQLLESKRKKRNARGKHKSKTRHYKRSTINLAVSFPTKKYGVDSSRLRLLPGQKVSVERGEKRSTVKLSCKLKLKSLEPIDKSALINAVSLAYRCATPPAGSQA